MTQFEDLFARSRIARRAICTRAVQGAHGRPLVNRAPYCPPRGGDVSHSSSALSSVPRCRRVCSCFSSAPAVCRWSVSCLVWFRYDLERSPSPHMRSKGSPCHARLLCVLPSFREVVAQRAPVDCGPNGSSWLQPDGSPPHESARVVKVQRHTPAAGFGRPRCEKPSLDGQTGETQRRASE